MRALATAGLIGTKDEAVILEEVRVEARLGDLLAEVTVAQRYRNPETTNIEAVYTFPLPIDAVLLAFEAEIGQRKLTGKVVEKSEAENRYENAVADGDAAVLLEAAGDGLYTASIGNLLPGETATIRFRYALLLRWNGDRVRFAIPTTIAPRYGDPAAAGLALHQVPEYACDAERAFSLRVAVKGLLRSARFNSPSHLVAVTSGTAETIIALAGTPAMDRDFVLEARLSQPEKASSLLAHDGEGWVALASFCPEIPETGRREPRSVKIVVDCSGSMGGPSIAQAKTALERILDSLFPGDLFDIVAFGSSQRALFGREVPVSETTLAKARGFVRALDADMGGTEIAAALDVAYAVRSTPSLPRDLLLITDGQVWNSEDVIARARSSNHRIFAVGVGNAIAEAFLRGLAEATGGASEFVSPREDMAGRIHRHFQRLYAPVAKCAAAHWPSPPSHCIPDPIAAVYGGDTLHLLAWFADKPEGDAELELVLSDGRRVSQRAHILPFEEGSAIPPSPADAPAGTLARMAAAARLLATKGEGEGLDLALRYQLISRWTNYLVVHVCAEADKAEDLPKIRKIPQVLAAGWHETHAFLCDSPVCFRGEVRLAAPAARSFLADGPADFGPASLIALLNRRQMPPLPTLDDLAAAGLPEPIVAKLRGLIAGGAPESAVTLAFLYLLVQSPESGAVARQVKRLILKSFRHAAPPRTLIESVTAASEEWLNLEKSWRNLMKNMLAIRP